MENRNNGQTWTANSSKHYSRFHILDLAEDVALGSHELVGLRQHRLAALLDQAHARLTGAGVAGHLQVGVIK